MINFDWGGAALVTLALLCGIAEGQTRDAALPPIQSADYDAHGRFRVNGEPFFPILLYGATMDEATLVELREFGFNVLGCRAEQCEGLPAKGFYGAIHGGKVQADTANVFLGIGADSPALYFKKNLLEQTAAANAKTIAAVPHRPLMNAIGYWEDEPAGVVAGKLPSRAVYEDLVAAIDVAAPYLYPVPYQPVASVREAVARAREATGGKKPILPILQIFAWEANSRYPTPAELRCMTFLALVEGASGIGFYAYTPVTGQAKGTTIAAAQPELWQSVKPLNREIAELGPLFCGDPSARPKSELLDGAPAVKIVVANRTSGLPAVLVNSTPERATARFTIAGVSPHARFVLADGRSVAVAESGATLSLDPFEVVIIRRCEPAE